MSLGKAYACSRSAFSLERPKMLSEAPWGSEKHPSWEPCGTLVGTFAPLGPHLAPLGLSVEGSRVHVKCASLGAHLGPKQAPLDPISTLLPSTRPLDGGRHSTSPWQSHSPLTPRGLSLGAFLPAGSIDQGQCRSRLRASDLIPNGTNSIWEASDADNYHIYSIK